MKQGLTEIVFILDESGSMSGLEKDTVGGFNSFIDRQRNVEGEALVSAVLFSGSSKVLYDRTELSKIEPMTEAMYCPGGCTALLDAVGNAVNHIRTIHKYAREEDLPEKTVFVITTDGEENSSREFTYRKVKELIERQQKDCGWEFLFLGANIDAGEEAARIGIAPEQAVRYECDSAGTLLNFEVLGEAMCSMREGKKLNRSWKRDIEKYYGEKKR